MSGCVLTAPFEVGDLVAELEADAPDARLVASVLLHGQPFGFTRDDVALIRQAIIHNNDPVIDECPGENLQETERLHDIADRIEALLRPDKK